MKYMIHSYVKRRWYVNEFLIPSMINQGINKKDIIIWEDDGTYGNLMSFVRSMQFVAECFNDKGAIWHLQDDIIVSNGFACVSKETSPKYLACGFTSIIGDGEQISSRIGWQNVKYSWMSFQGIQIPNRYCAHFVEWFNRRVVKEGLFRNRYVVGKYDDFFFHWFVKTEHENDMVYNIYPNIVNHVDNIVGQSTCNPRDVGKNISRWWNDYDLIDDLRTAVTKYKIKEGIEEISDSK